MGWYNGQGWSSKGGWEKPVVVGGGRTTLFTYNDFRSSAFPSNNAAVPTQHQNQSDPDGGTLASLITADGTSAVHKIAKTQSITPSVQTYYRGRFKAGTITRFALREDQQTGNGAVFDLVAGTVVGNLVSGTGSIASLGGSWYMCEVGFTYIASSFSGIRLSFLRATDTDLSFETNSSADTIYAYKWEIQTL